MVRVYHTYSRLKAPLDDVKQHIETGIDLPDGIEEIELETINDRLHIRAVPSDETLSSYTPTAAIKGSVSEKLVAVDDDGTVTHESPSEHRQNSGWSRMAEDEDELETVEVTYIDLYGRGDEVLVHDELRAGMFDVLCQLARVSVSGYVQGIILEDGELRPVMYEAGGEEVDAEINIDRADASNGASADGSESENDAAQWTQYS